MKFALIETAPEAIQDLSFEFSELMSFKAVGGDPSNDSVLAFVYSDLLDRDGFNGFVEITRTENGIDFTLIDGTIEKYERAILLIHALHHKEV